MLLKTHWKAVIAGILSGVLTSLVTVFVLSKIMSLSHKEYVTMLPKSITTAIGMGVSEELGGYVTITVAVIIVTGFYFCQFYIVYYISHYAQKNVCRNED